MNKMMFWKVELWFVLLLLIFLLIGTYCFGVMVRYIGHPKLAIIREPVTFAIDLPQRLYKQFVSRQEVKDANMPESLRDYDFSNPVNEQPVALSLITHGNTVNEYRIVKISASGTKEVITLNVPGGEQIFQIFYLNMSGRFFYAMNATNIDNATIYDSGSRYILKYTFDKEGNITREWKLTVNSHHLVTVDESGYIYTPIHDPPESLKRVEILADVNQRLSGKTYYGSYFRDEGAAIVSPEGKVLHLSSLVELFEKNDMGAYIYGIGPLEPDPFHVNSVDVMRKDNPVAGIQKGDLLLSLRHRSMLLIYRPETMKIIWYKIGPWLNQHSAFFTPEGDITVFNNNIISTAQSRTSEDRVGFINSPRRNEFLLHEIAVDQTRAIYDECLPPDDVHTLTGGDLKFYDGYLTASFHNSGILVTCSLNEKVKSYFASIDDGIIDRTAISFIQLKE